MYCNTVNDENLEAGTKVWRIWRIVIFHQILFANIIIANIIDYYSIQPDSCSATPMYVY